MKRKILKKTVATAMVCTALVASLTACGGNNSDSSNQGGSSKEYTLTSFLEKQDVAIFYNVKELNKDTVPRELYCFEDGKITVIPYEAEQTLGELSKMKDKEIIELASTAYIEKRDVGLQKALNEDYDSFQMGTPLTNGYEVDKEYFMSWYDKMKNCESGPFISSYTIGINTDGSGNNTASETVFYAMPEELFRINEFGNIANKYAVLSIDAFDILTGSAKSYGALTITIGSNTMPIYDSYYATLNGHDGENSDSNGFFLITRVDNESTYIRLDEVDTKDTLTDPNLDEINEQYLPEISKRVGDVANEITFTE